MLRHILCIATIFVFGPVHHAYSQGVAFPGAEGFGKYTTGGRGGRVVVVNHLGDHGPGSLRSAIEMDGPRLIIFSVSGTIALESPLSIKEGNITIAGQSSPGGICLKNFPLVIEADNVIIRFMRFRLGDESSQQTDAITAIKGNSDIIIDHCSMSWATDECASFYRNRNFTLQWCIISESLNRSVHEKGDHGYGGIWGGAPASFHHNLLACHNSRLPRFSGSESTRNGSDELVDFRNNVIYNWVNNNIYGGESGRYNVVGNYYLPGPATKKSKHFFINPWRPFGKFYVDRNFFAGNKYLTENNRSGIFVDNVDSTDAITPFPVIAPPDQSAESAFKCVLECSGAIFYRDSVDARLISEILNANSRSGPQKNGIIDSQRDVGGWPQLRKVRQEDDSDADGMPDIWEVEHGLNPGCPADSAGRDLDNEYDNVEVYLNELVSGAVNSY